MIGSELHPDLLDEASLLARLKAGENAAYEELIRALGGRMLATARRFLPSEDDASDAVQDAFISAFKALPEFEGNSKLGTWLHRIVVNACLMKLRSRRRRPERAIEDLLPAFAADGHHAAAIRSWEEPAEDALDRKETCTLVRSCIDELPEAYRTVLMLRDIEGLDTQTTAAMLDLTPNAVKTRLHRARQALRTLLDPHLKGELP